MEVYFFNAVSLLLSSFVVTLIAVAYRGRRRTKEFLLFVISFLGSSLGLITISLFDIHKFGRELSLLLQFMAAFITSGILMGIFLYLQISADSDD
ncbi:MAG: hypothetical protein ACR2PY_05380 [Salinispira sp.]